MSWIERFPFVKAPTCVISNNQMSPYARLLYLYMLGRAGDRGWWFPDHGQSEIAEDMGFSKRKVQHCIEELKRCGLLRTGRINHYGAVKYYVDTPVGFKESSAPRAPSSARRATDNQEQAHHVPTQYLRKNNTLERTPQMESSFSMNRPEPDDLPF